MKPARYPLPGAERRVIIQELAELARALDAEAESRLPKLGTWNDVVHLELARAAGVVRLVATLLVNGSMSDRRGHFWLVASRDYLRLVRRADKGGVIR